MMRKASAVSPSLQAHQRWRAKSGRRHLPQRERQQETVRTIRMPCQGTKGERPVRNHLVLSPVGQVGSHKEYLRRQKVIRVRKATAQSMAGCLMGAQKTGF